MIPYVMDRFLALAHYDADTENFVIDSDVNGFLTAKQSATRAIDLATLGNITDPQGFEFELMVKYQGADFDNSNLDEWEHISASYEDNSGVIAFHRERTMSSSTGGAITFDAGSANLVIFATAGAEQFAQISQRQNDSRLLQEGLVTSTVFGGSVLGQSFTSGYSGTAVTNGSTGTMIVTPRSADSTLYIDYFAEVLSRNTATGQSFRCVTIGRYIDSSGSPVDRGESITIGGVTFPNDDNMGINSSVASSIDLDSTHLNADGNWEFVLGIRISDANSEISLQGLRVHYREVL